MLLLNMLPQPICQSKKKLQTQNTQMFLKTNLERKKHEKHAKHAKWSEFTQFTELFMKR